MTRDCGTIDFDLELFADGFSEDLDSHVASCDECQAFLAELWDGGLEHDLTEPVLTALRLEEYLIAAAKVGGDLLAAFVEAVVRYGLGSAKEPEEG